MFQKCPCQFRSLNKFRVSTVEVNFINQSMSPTESTQCFFVNMRQFFVVLEETTGKDDNAL